MTKSKETPKGGDGQDRRHTLAEVAKELGVSTTRAYQIEQRALRKARKILEAKGYTLEDFIGEHE